MVAVKSIRRYNEVKRGNNNARVLIGQIGRGGEAELVGNWDE